MFNELLAKIQFWRAKNLKLGEDYDFFLDLSNHEALAIKNFKGISWIQCTLKIIKCFILAMRP